MHRKKALRIILALRAGQVRTSSGTQKAARPGQHIGSILGEAMRVRFGSDPDALHVDAYGWSSPLLYNEHGQVEAANIRFAISTPVAVSPGDAIRVRVQTQKGWSPPTSVTKALDFQHGWLLRQRRTFASRKMQIPPTRQSLWPRALLLGCLWLGLNSINNILMDTIR
jgi:hypothetical protein